MDDDNTLDRATGLWILMSNIAHLWISSPNIRVSSPHDESLSSSATELDEDNFLPLLTLFEGLIFR